MAGEEKDALPRVGSDVELADDVVHGNRAEGGNRGDEIIRLNLRTVLFQNLLDQILRFPMAG